MGTLEEGNLVLMIHWLRLKMKTVLPVIVFEVTKSRFLAEPET
jgi:hypothetical protein